MPQPNPQARPRGELGRRGSSPRHRHGPGRKAQGVQARRPGRPPARGSGLVEHHNRRLHTGHCYTQQCPLGGVTESHRFVSTASRFCERALIVSLAGRPGRVVRLTVCTKSGYPRLRSLRFVDAGGTTIAEEDSRMSGPAPGVRSTGPASLEPNMETVAHVIVLRSRSPRPSRGRSGSQPDEMSDDAGARMHASP